MPGFAERAARFKPAQKGGRDRSHLRLVVDSEGERVTLAVVDDGLGFDPKRTEELFSGLRLAAVLIHPVAAIVAITGIIVHIYMGTLAIPGALRSMTRGWATEGWAAAHRPKWYREISKR